MDTVMGAMKPEEKELYEEQKQADECVDKKAFS